VLTNPLDQVGLSQKNGSVVSHIKVSLHPILAPRIAPGAALEPFRPIEPLPCLLTLPPPPSRSHHTLSPHQSQDLISLPSRTPPPPTGRATAVLAADLLTAVAAPNLATISPCMPPRGGGGERGQDGGEEGAEGCTTVVVNTDVAMPGSFASNGDLQLPHGAMLDMLHAATGG
jgi:hypothetical protein